MNFILKLNYDFRLKIDVSIKVESLSAIYNIMRAPSNYFSPFGRTK